MVLVLLTFLNCYTLSCTLCSSSDTHMLKIQQDSCRHGFHIFPCFGPHIWNSLAQDLRHCSTQLSFKAKLKTFFFSHYFCPNQYQYPVSATVSVCVFSYITLCKLFWENCALCVYRILYLGKYVSFEHSGGVEERLINVHYYIMHKHLSDHLEVEKQEGKM